MNIELTDSFKKKIKKLTQKDPGLKTALIKQLQLFKNNPHHPSLRLHKLKGTRSEQVAIWIKGDLRALGIKSRTIKDTYVFFDLITHDEY